MGSQLWTMGERERDEESGRFTEEYPTEDFIDALEAEGGAAGTQDIADQVGVIYDTAYKKLVALEDAGKITSRKVANARLWELNNNE